MSSANTAAIRKARCCKKIVNLFLVREHDNHMHKEQEGQRGEFYFCLPLTVRLIVDQKKHEVIEAVVSPLRVGSRAQKIPLLSTGIFSKCGAPDSPHAL